MLKAFEVFLPTLVPIAAGYALARYTGLDAAPLRTLARYVLVPTLLFVVLLGALQTKALEFLFQPKTLAVLGAAGAGMVLIVLHGLAPFAKATKLHIDGTLTMPNMAVLALPFISLSWGGKSSKSVIALLFVAAALAYVISQHKARAPKALVREPWFWAVVAAIAFKVFDLPMLSIYKFVGSLAEAAYPLCLVYLGTMLYPLADVRDKNAWVSAGVRLAFGLAVALIILKLFPVNRAVSEVLIIAGLTAPATAGVALVRAGDKERLSSAGVMASLAALIVFHAGSWFD